VVADANGCRRGRGLGKIVNRERREGRKREAQEKTKRFFTFRTELNQQKFFHGGLFGSLRDQSLQINSDLLLQH
jgi:hypothetical protein